MTYEEFLVKVKDGILDDKGNCPVTPLMLMLQGKWKNQILYEFCCHDTIRFGELKKNLGNITNTVLVSALKELEENGFITRTQYDEMPLRVEYSFSQKGRDLMPVFYAMMNWGFKYSD